MVEVVYDLYVDVLDVERLIAVQVGLDLSYYLCYYVPVQGQLLVTLLGKLAVEVRKYRCCTPDVVLVYALCVQEGQLQQVLSRTTVRSLEGVRKDLVGVELDLAQTLDICPS